MHIMGILCCASLKVGRSHPLAAVILCRVMRVPAQIDWIGQFEFRAAQYRPFFGQLSGLWAYSAHTLLIRF